MPPETLHIATLGLCMFTLLLATAALMPQLKRAFTLVKDALLISVIVLVLTFAGFVGWGKVFELREKTDSEEPFPIPELFEASRLGNAELDPLPLPNADDDLTMTPSQSSPGIVSPFNTKSLQGWPATRTDLPGSNSMNNR